MMSSPKPVSESKWDQMYVDGKWIDATSGETLHVSDPSTREAFAEVPAATEQDVDTAYEAAHEAQSGWEATSRADRNELIKAALDELRERSDELVELLAREGGSASGKARGELALTLSDFETALDLAPPEEEVRDSAFTEGKRHHIVEEPVGVVGIISPWNYPVHLTTRALAPALALGSTVVVKPASDTPISGGLFLAEVADEVGFPDGVVNVITGRGADIGDRMAGHPVPRVISFTGSTAVGKQVASQAGSSITQPALELGGNGPNVVTDDVDVDRAARIGAVGSFTHQGQVCISINRHIVHEDIYDDYVEKLTAYADSLDLGNPTTDDVDLGPLINQSQFDSITGFISESIEQGATLETGGEADGLFFEPTVLSGATNEMAAACNEHFGPVAPVIAVGSDEEAVEVANDTEYGLAASIQCDDDDRARSLADRIESGMVHINDHPIQDEPNAPFGGFKQSGLGRYNSEWVRDELLEDKWISVQHDEREYGLLD